jgi:hypothetical protein
MTAPLVNQQYYIKKMQGKSGWTYTEIPEIPQDKKAPFGWVQVRGTIDSYEINQYKLMPMGNGHLFLPLKAEVRKQIRKKEGDWVHITLYADDSPVEIPDEFLLCLLDSPNAHRFFQTLTNSAQKQYIDWMYAAKRLETRVHRIAKAIEKMERGLKLYENN